ncbi:hypothetical protein JCM10212_002517 [Sporobolomyces blumeae]
MATTTIHPAPPPRHPATVEPLRADAPTSTSPEFVPPNSHVRVDDEARRDMPRPSAADVPTERTRHRPPFMTDRHRSSSAPHGLNPFRVRRPAPPVRPIFPPHDNVEQQRASIPAYRPPPGLPPPRDKRERERDQDELARREQAMLQQAIDESRRDAHPDRRREEEDVELQRAIDASQADARQTRSPPMSAREQDELQRALALSADSHQPSRNPPVTYSATPSRPGRSRSVSNPEALPPFPFTEADLVRPSYPPEKSRLFPQGLPTLPPGAGSTNDESEREMEMLALAIRISEEEERLRREREEHELREVVRKVEARERELLSRRQPPIPRRPSPPEATSAGGDDDKVSPTSPQASPKKQSRATWIKPPLASKFSTGSPPASPPMSPQSTTEPRLVKVLADSTQADHHRRNEGRPGSAEALPFSNLVPTSRSTAASSRPAVHAPPHPTRAPPPPPHPTRLPPSPPETPVVATSTFPVSYAPPIPPLPPQRQRSGSDFPPSPTSVSASGLPVPFPPAHHEAFRLENDGSPVEMPYLTPSTSLRSLPRSGEVRQTSWILDDRSGSNTGSGSGSGHSRVNSSNRRSSEMTAGDGSGGGSSRSRSEEEHGDSPSAHDDDEDSGSRRGSPESVLLAIRNPDDESSAPPIEQQHQGGYTEEPPSVDVPRDVDANEYPDSGEGLVFESAYAGRSMSAIDEATEPASSILADEGGGTDDSRQGSYPSTTGTGGSTLHRAVEEVDELEELGPGTRQGGEGMERSITYNRPVDEREWMHHANHPNKPSQPAPSLTPTPPRSVSPGHDARRPPSASRGSGEIRARQLTHTSAETNSSADPRFNFPLPPFVSTLPPTLPSPSESPSLIPPIELRGAGANSDVSSRRTDAESTSTHRNPVFNDGTRFGHPSICAREPGHVCPDDGLSGTRTDVPETVQLTAVFLDGPGAAIGLGVGRETRTADRAATGGKRILRDAWAVEARTWGGLLRFLMWYGDTTILASPQDIALEATRHCTAEASVEFRPDDEGFTIIRLLVAILPPNDPDSHTHRDLTVEHPGSTPPANGKGKGKAKSYFPSAATSTERFPLVTFHLPDSVHLPCRLSSLAIQLYTLRHLASIARSTQPAKEGAAPGYLALRELSIALDDLAKVAHERKKQEHEPTGVRPSPAVSIPDDNDPGGRTSGDENERLLTRLRDRLRRLKRGSTTSEPASGQWQGQGAPGLVDSAPTRPNKLVKAPPRDHAPRISAPIATQQLPRRQRVLSAANDDDDDDHAHDEGASRNHVEVDGARWSMIHGSPRAPPRPLSQDPNLRTLGDETAYLPVLRS